MRYRLLPAAWILIAIAIGISLGYAIFTCFVSVADKKVVATIVLDVSIMSSLIKLLIAPLVFSALVVGIAHRAEGKSVWSVFGMALGLFVTVSLLLGLVMSNLLGDGLEQMLRCQEASPGHAQCQ